MSKRGQLAYIREVLRSYPEIKRKPAPHRTDNEAARLRVVEDMMDEIGRMPDGAQRQRFVRMLYFEGRYTFWGVIGQVPISQRTARRWNARVMDIMANKMNLI